MNKRMSEIAVSIFIIAICGFFYYDTYNITKPRFEPLGSAFFPRAILISIMFLSLVHILQKLFAKHKSVGTNDLGGAEPAGWSKKNRAVFTIAVIALFTVYILMISYTEIHYLVLTFFFVFLMSWFLAFCQVRAIPVILACSVGVVAVIYLIFGLLLQTFFP